MDQIISKIEYLILNVNLMSLFGKSDRVCTEMKVKVKLDFDYIKRQQRNWSILKEKEDDIDLNYNSHTFDVNEIWEELNRKIKSEMKTIPGVITTFSKQGDPAEKLPLDSNQLLHQREDDKVRKGFGIIPSMENYQSSLNKDVGGCSRWHSWRG